MEGSPKSQRQVLINTKLKSTRNTLRLFNIAMENGPFVDDFPIETTIYRGFSMAMLVITRW